MQAHCSESSPSSSPNPEPNLEQASEAGDPFKLKETVDEIREDLNPHPAGQKALNAPKKEELTGVQHRGTLLYEGPCSVLSARALAHRASGPPACSGRAAGPGRSIASAAV